MRHAVLGAVLLGCAGGAIAGCDLILGIEELPADGSGGATSASSSADSGTAVGSTSSVGSASASSATSGSSSSSAVSSSASTGSGAVDPPSCQGLPKNCGSDGKQSCCAVDVVDGASGFKRDNGTLSATVSDFKLDRFEVTVGRFAKFQAQFTHAGTMAGKGANPHVANSGWQTAFNIPLPSDKMDLASKLDCDGTYSSFDKGDPVVPINCVTWFEAFAFCIYDEARLPTELEMNFAQAGGNAQRLYPWGSTPAPSNSLAVYSCMGSDGIAGAPGTCIFEDLQHVGSRVAGNGAFGNADLAGNLKEWTLDFFEPYPATCVDCASLSNPSMNGQRAIRGGSFNDGPNPLRTDAREGYSASASAPTDAANRNSSVGFRCARD